MSPIWMGRRSSNAAPMFRGLRLTAKVTLVKAMAFECRPDVQGIETYLTGQCSLPFVFECRPDVQGIETDASPSNRW